MQALSAAARRAGPGGWPGRKGKRVRTYTRKQDGRTQKQRAERGQVGSQAGMPYILRLHACRGAPSDSAHSMAMWVARPAAGAGAGAR